MAYMFHNLYAMLELHLIMKIFLAGENFSEKLMNQGYIQSKLVQTIKKFYGRHLHLVSKYGMSVSALVKDMFDAI